MSYLVKLSPDSFSSDDNLECLWIGAIGEMRRTPFGLEPFTSFSEAALVAQLYQSTLNEHDLAGGGTLKEGAVSQASVCLSPLRLEVLGIRVRESEWEKKYPRKLDPKVEEQRWSSEIAVERIQQAL